MQSFWQWFIGEAGAGWIIGILGVIGGVYAWLRRERPPRIVIQEVKQISLLDIHPSQSDKIHVGYSDTDGSEHKIESLEQVKLAVYNLGTKDITETVDFVLTFRRKKQPADAEDSESIGFWRLVFDDATCEAESIPTDGSVHEQSVRIRIPYLNSYRTHHHYALAYLMTEHAAQLQLVRGNGKGWSASLSTLDQFWTRRRTMARAVRMTAIGLVLLAGVLCFFVMLGDPFYAVQITPTLDNVDRLIELLTRLRESVLAHGVSPYGTRFFEGLHSGLANSFIMATLLLVVLAYISSYLISHQHRLAGLLAAKSLNVVPPERWDTDTSKSHRDSWISRLLDALQL